MTNAEFRRLVKKWQHRLGLGYWRIHVNFTEFTDDSAFMEIHRSKNYDDATIHLNREWKSWPVNEIERLIIHELLHLVTRDIDYVMYELVEAQLSPSANNAIRQAYEYANEKSINRLAHILYEMEVKTKQESVSADEERDTDKAGR